jgi:hypothetical protein
MGTGTAGTAPWDGLAGRLGPEADQGLRPDPRPTGSASSPDGARFLFQLPAAVRRRDRGLTPYGPAPNGASATLWRRRSTPS